MRFTSIASGSSGNVAYIGTDKTHVLVDVGIRMKAVNEGLSELGLNLSDIDAIFLTHEHIDHIRAVGTISRRYGIPVYGTLETLKAVLLENALGEVPKEILHPVLPDEALSVGDLSVLPFSIEHDAADPVGYRIEGGGKKVAVATDMGRYSEYVLRHLQELDALLVESNHDIDMLIKGSYPIFLKRRILSGHGHLSNLDAGQLVDKILHEGIRQIFLAHLSEENNYPDLALRTVRQEIDRSESAFHAKDFPIAIARRSSVSEIVLL